MSGLPPSADRDALEFNSPKLDERRAIGGAAGQHVPRRGQLDMIGMATGVGPRGGGGAVGAGATASAIGGMGSPSSSSHAMFGGDGGGITSPSHQPHALGGRKKSGSLAAADHHHHHHHSSHKDVLGQLASQSAHNALHGATAGPNQHPEGLGTALDVVQHQNRSPNRSPLHQRHHRSGSMHTASSSMSPGAAAPAASSSSAAELLRQQQQQQQNFAEQSPANPLSMPFEQFAKNLSQFQHPMVGSAQEGSFSSGGGVGGGITHIENIPLEHSGFSQALTESAIGGIGGGDRSAEGAAAPGASDKRWEPGKRLMEKIGMVANVGVVPDTARSANDAASGAAAAPGPRPKDDEGVEMQPTKPAVTSDEEDGGSGKKKKKRRRKKKGQQLSSGEEDEDPSSSPLQKDASAANLGQQGMHTDFSAASFRMSPTSATYQRKKPLILRGQLYEMHCEHNSLYYFPADHPTRRRLFLLIDSLEFEYFVLAVIFVYFGAMFLAVPEVASDQTLLALYVVEWVVQVLYTVEAAMKMVALGVFVHEGSYFSSRMNLLDFCLLVIGWVAIPLADPYHRMLASLRCLRCFRVLISLQHVSELRAISTTFSASAAKLRDVLILMTFAVVSLAVLGLQIFVGDIERRCVRPVPKSVCMDMKLWEGAKPAAAAAACGIDNETFTLWYVNRSRELGLIASSASLAAATSTMPVTVTTAAADGATTSMAPPPAALCLEPASQYPSASDCEFCNFPAALDGNITFPTNFHDNSSALGQLSDSPPPLFPVNNNGSSSAEFAYTFLINPEDTENGCASDGENGHLCSPGSVCVRNYTLHQDPFLNFNNIGNAFLFVVKLVTLDNWPADTKAMQQSSGFAFFVYTFVLVVVATYFCVNLVLAILSSGYEHATHQANELRMLAEQEAALMDDGKKNIHDDESDDASSVGDEDEDAVAASMEMVEEKKLDAMNKEYAASTSGGMTRTDTTGAVLGDDDSRSAGDLDSEMALRGGRNNNGSSSSDAEAAGGAGKSKALQQQQQQHGAADDADITIDDGDHHFQDQKEEGIIKQARLLVRDFTEHPYFGHTILLVTFINVLSLMLDHHGIPTTMEAVLEEINLVCTVIFLVEMVLKLFGLGLLGYVHDYMNLFDGALCVISIFELIFLSGGGGSKVSALRAFRLTRAFRVIKSSKRLRIMIVTVLRAAYASIVIFGLLFLYLVCGALIVVSFIPDAIDSQVRPNLTTFFDALLALFIVLTGENWYDTAKLAAEGSSIATLFFFVLFFIVGNYLFLNFVIVILIANFEQSVAGHDDLLDDDDEDEDHHAGGAGGNNKVDVSDDDDEEEEEEEDEEKEKEHSGTKKEEEDFPKQTAEEAASINAKMKARIFGALARTADDEQHRPAASGSKGNSSRRSSIQPVVSFAAAAAADSGKRKVHFKDVPVKNLQSESSSTTAAAEATTENRNSPENAAEGGEAVDGKPAAAAALGSAVSSLKNKVKRAAMLAGTFSPTVAAKKKKKREEELLVSQLQYQEEAEDSKSRAEQCIDSTVAFLRESAGADDGADIDPEPTYFGLLARGNCFRELCIGIVQHWAFEWMVTLVTLETCLALGFETPEIDMAANPEIRTFIEVNNYLAPVFFGIETVIRTVARGWVSYPTAYLRDWWSCLDFFVFITSVISIFVEQVKILRSLRIFRFASKIDSVKVVIETMVNILPTMSNVVLLLLFVFVIFAVLGVQFFKGKFVRCNDPSVTHECECVGNFTRYHPGVTGIDDNTTVFSVKSEVLSRRWQHAFLNFNNVGNALFTLVVLMFSEQWSEVLFNAMDAADADPIVAMSTNANPAAALYFVLFMIIGNFFLYNLFVGSLMAAFGEEREKRSFRILDQGSGGHQLLTEAQQQWLRTYQIAQASNLQPRVPLPENRVRRFFCQIYFQDEHCAQPRTEFEAIITASILINVIFMASAHSTQPAYWVEGQWVVNLIFACVFAVEAIVKIFALLPSGYFPDHWNQFDFVLVLLAFVSAFLGGEGGVQIPGASAIRVLRVLRVLRLVKRAKGLQRLFGSLVHALPQLLNVTVLLLLLLFVFGVIGTDVFGMLYSTDSDPDWIITSYFNFKNAGSAMVLLFQIATTEGWPRVVEAAASDETNSACSAAAGTCGNPVAAYFFFIFFMLMVNCVALNLFVFVIIDQYMSMNSDSAAATQVLLERLNHFRELWEYVDVEATQKIRWEQFVLIMHRVFAILTTTSDFDHADIARVMAEEEEMSKKLGAKSDLKLFRKFRMMDVPVDNVGRVSYRESILGISREHFGLTDEETAAAAKLLSLPEPLDPSKYKHVVKIHHLLAVRTMQRRFRATVARRKELLRMDTDPVYRLRKMPGMKGGSRSVSPSGGADGEWMPRGASPVDGMFAKAEDHVSPSAFMPPEERIRRQRMEEVSHMQELGIGAGAGAGVLAPTQRVPHLSEIQTSDGPRQVAWRQQQQSASPEPFSSSSSGGGGGGGRNQSPFRGAHRPLPRTVPEGRVEANPFSRPLSPDRRGGSSGSISSANTRPPRPAAASSANKNDDMRVKNFGKV